MRLHGAVIGGLVAGLMCSTAAVAQDGSGYSAGFTVGGIGFLMPDYEAPGVITDGVGGVEATHQVMLFGGVLAGSWATPLSDDGRTLLGKSGFMAIGVGNSTMNVTLDGQGTLFLPGYTTPTGTIEVNASYTGGGTVTSDAVISGTGGDGSSDLDNAGSGAQDGWGANQSGSAFTLFGGGTFNDPADIDDLAFAFGAIASTEGGVFLATGDLTGVEITSSLDSTVVYGGIDLSIARAGEGNIQGYVGPSYRYLKQDYTSDIMINMLETDVPPDTTFADYTQSTNEVMTSHYLGGAAGISYVAASEDGNTFSFGGEVGVYNRMTDFEGMQSYTLSGGVPALVEGDQTVTNSTTLTDSDSGIAYALRGQAVWTKPTAENRQISFGLGGEYLSSVPTLTRSYLGSNFGGTTDDADYTGPETSDTPMLSFGEMFNVSGTVSWTGQF
ncbi:hypothetical protein [Cucumibacter marinus]|uniref:hypothetical protein n=1 Tax=Cucumibacter marinus TaxID=1121252 RepID=UPI00049089C7|nr:hypothetical protein [Cucumibacter marinus]